MHNHLISAIVCAYNEGINIKRCLKSLSVQTDNNYELIIVDDGTDNNDPSIKIMDKYGQEHLNTTVIHKTNGGSISARMSGVSNANGDYITFIDADDFVSVNYIETIHNIVSNNKADLYQLNNKLNKKSKKNFEIEKNFLVDGSSVSVTEMYQWVLTGKTGAVWDKIYRRDLFPNINSPIFYGDDVFINVNYLKNVNSIVAIDKAIYYHISDSTTSGSVTSRSGKKFFDIDDLYLFVKKLRVNFIINDDTFKQFIQVYLTNIAHGAGDLYKLGVSKRKITSLLNQLSIIKDCLSSIRPQGLKKYVYIWCLKRKQYSLVSLIDKVVHN